MDRKKALKKLEKLKSNRKNCSFDLIENILTAFGFEETQPGSGSSHYKYTRKEKIIIIPFARPIKENYVKFTIKILEDIIENEYE